MSDRAWNRASYVFAGACVAFAIGDLAEGDVWWALFGFLLAAANFYCGITEDTTP